MARPLSLTPANLAVSTTLLVYDWICTLDQEVVHIWSKPGPWSLGSVIFLFNRYMPFVDIFLSIHLTFGTPAPSSAECLLLMKATSWLTFTGLALSEFVLMLRTYALWERSRRVLLAFIAMFAILVIPGIIVTQMEVRSLQFGPSTDISCQLIEASNIVFVSYLLLLFCETIIAGLTLVKGYQHLRRTRSRWVVRLYKDGLFFYIYLCLLSLGNIITFIVSPDWGPWLTSLQRVLHSLLCNRVLFVILSKRRPTALDVDVGGNTVTHGTDSMVVSADLMDTRASWR